MNEREWPSAADPEPLFVLLRALDAAQQPSNRKLHLFAVACCRRVWELLADERSEQALEVLERWLEGRAQREELLTVHGQAREVWASPARSAVVCASVPDGGIEPADRAAHYAAWADRGRSRAEERQTQAALLRCIVGNPYRALAIDPSWMTPTVLGLAQTAYQERDLPSGRLDADRLGVLADALEDAGCTEAEILGHLRGPGPHARGCFVLDRLLGRE
jgi:hypothetical protein